MQYVIKRKELSEDELMHWKYLSKEKIKGKWRYYYDKINPKDNPYDINSKNYNEKIKELAKDKEWQAIVKRNDPEYVKKNSDGTTKYLIDDYLLNKKHPVIDGLKDVGMGRKVSINKITYKSTIAGFKDYVRMGRKTIENTIALGTLTLSTGIKNSQGSYDKQKKQFKANVKTGKKMVDDTLKAYSTYSKTDSYQTSKKVTDAVAAAKKTYDNIPPEQKEQVNKSVNKAYNNLAPEQKKQVNNVANKAVGKAYDKLPSEQKKQVKEAYNKLPNEQKKQINNAANEAYENMSTKQNSTIYNPYDPNSPYYERTIARAKKRKL